MSIETLPVRVIYPEGTVAVKVDTDTLTQWTADGRSLEWSYHRLAGVIFRDTDGISKKVADVILGEPAGFTDGDPLDLTRANLRPVR